MTDPLNTTNNLNQPPSHAEHVDIPADVVQQNPQRHFSSEEVLVWWNADVEHQHSTTPKQNITCAGLKKQGKEKKPDANLVGTPFPEP